MALNKPLLFSSSVSKKEPAFNILSYSSLSSAQIFNILIFKLLKISDPLKKTSPHSLGSPQKRWKAPVDTLKFIFHPQVINETPLYEQSSASLSGIIGHVFEEENSEISDKRNFYFLLYPSRNIKKNDNSNESPEHLLGEVLQSVRDFIKKNFVDVNADIQIDIPINQPQFLLWRFLPRRLQRRLMSNPHWTALSIFLEVQNSLEEVEDNKKSPLILRYKNARLIDPRSLKGSGSWADSWKGKSYKLLTYLSDFVSIKKKLKIFFGKGIFKRVFLNVQMPQDKVNSGRYLTQELERGIKGETLSERRRSLRGDKEQINKDLAYIEAKKNDVINRYKIGLDGIDKDAANTLSLEKILNRLYRDKENIPHHLHQLYKALANEPLNFLKDLIKKHYGQILELSKINNSSKENEFATSQEFSIPLAVHETKPIDIIPVPIPSFSSVEAVTFPLKKEKGISGH